MGQEKVSVLVVFPFQIRRSFHQILPLSSVCYPPDPMDPGLSRTTNHIHPHTSGRRDYFVSGSRRK